MTRGQDSLMMELDRPEQMSSAVDMQALQPLIVKLANEAENAAHKEYLAALEKSGSCLWNTVKN